jgi:ketosteroid isomerase-like protein
MSQENVELVRQAYEAWNRGDVGSVLEILDLDIEWNTSDVFFDQPHSYHGRSAWQGEFLPELMETFEAYRAEPEELIDAGEQVVALVRVGATGRSSGAEGMARVGHVVTVRGGRITRFTEYKEAGDALEAAGLAE